MSCSPGRSPSDRDWRLRVGLTLGVVIVIGLVLASGGLAASTSPCVSEQQAPELVLPDVARATQSAGDILQPTEPEGLGLAALAPLRATSSWRFGLGVPGGAAQAAWVPRLGAGWWYDWSVRARSEAGSGTQFWQMVRLGHGKVTPPLEQLVALAQSEPGQTWIVGNEPDVLWQDNASPACFAFLYHQVYAALKRVDPSAQVGAGGIAQASPVRLAYLDDFLREYERRYHSPPLVDFWTMHAFALPEQHGSWGVGLPPGTTAETGWTLTVTDHDDLDLFHSQVIAFRRWMRDRGYGDRPLVITEYGILLSPEYGFGPERVEAFMRATFDWLLTARDESLGLAADNYHLVQRWAWFSLADPIYPTGDLVHSGADRLTLLGSAYREYIAGLP